MAYISQTNTINGWFKRYAVVEFDVPFYEEGRFGGGSLALNDECANCHVLEYHVTDMNSGEGREHLDWTCIANEATDPYSWPDNAFQFNIDDDSSDSVPIKVIIPVVEDKEDAQKLANIIKAKDLMGIFFLAVTYNRELLVINVRYEIEGDKLFTEVYADQLNIPFKVCGEYRWSKK